MRRITVIKQDHRGAEMWRYQGALLSRSLHQIELEAEFDRDDYLVHELVLRRGDRFVETYFDDHWYNIYEIFDREDGRRKAWYCNIGRPAIIQDDVVTYQDLALDLLVFPDGRQFVLDEQEFADLELPEETRELALLSLAQLQSMFQNLPERKNGDSG